MNSSLFRLIGYSFLGLFSFFVPIEINGKPSILLGHIVNFITNDIKILGYIITLIFLTVGGILPIFKSEWKQSKFKLVLVMLKFLSIPLGVFYLMGQGPEIIMAKNMVPFLFEKLVMPVGLIVPIGSIFLSFLVGYGLLEFIGVLLEPIMRPIWKTPGRSAIDAVASFTGSYSIGLLITNRVYNEGKYSAKEAAIIATGFSTVSATFMLIVAKTLGLIEIWNFYFWSCLAITFIVTAITVRIKPLSSMDNTVLSSFNTEHLSDNLLIQAYQEGLSTAKKAPTLWENIKSNFVDGLNMSINIVPLLLSVGLIGLLIAEYTPLFDWVGYIFYPVLKLLQVPDALIVAKAIATGFAEMFLPALYSVEASFPARYIVGVVSVSSILFLSGSIPCIMSTDIPISIGKLIMIWLQRTILSIVFATMFSYFII